MTIIEIALLATGVLFWIAIGVASLWGMVRALVRRRSRLLWTDEDSRRLFDQPNPRGDLR